MCRKSPTLTTSAPGTTGTKNQPVSSRRTFSPTVLWWRIVMMLESVCGARPTARSGSGQDGYEFNRIAADAFSKSPFCPAQLMSDFDMPNVPKDNQRSSAASFLMCFSYSSYKSLNKYTVFLLLNNNTKCKPNLLILRSSFLLFFHLISFCFLCGYVIVTNYKYNKINVVNVPFSNNLV